MKKTYTHKKRQVTETNSTTTTTTTLPCFDSCISIREKDT